MLGSLFFPVVLATFALSQPAIAETLTLDCGRDLTISGDEVVYEHVHAHRTGLDAAGRAVFTHMEEETYFDVTFKIPLDLLAGSGVGFVEMRIERSFASPEVHNLLCRPRTLALMFAEIRSPGLQSAVEALMAPGLPASAPLSEARLETGSLARLTRRLTLAGGQIEFICTHTDEDTGYEGHIYTTGCALYLPPGATHVAVTSPLESSFLKTHMFALIGCHEAGIEIDVPQSVWTDAHRERRTLDVRCGETCDFQLYEGPRH